MYDLASFSCWLDNPDDRFGKSLKLCAELVVNFSSEMTGAVTVTRLTEVMNLPWLRYIEREWVQMREFLAGPLPEPRTRELLQSPRPGSKELSAVQRCKNRSTQDTVIHLLA